MLVHHHPVKYNDMLLKVEYSWSGLYKSWVPGYFNNYVLYGGT